MRLIPPVSSAAQSNDQIPHLYTFTIPPDTEAVYLGSFHAQCRRSKDSYLTNIKACSNKLVLSDERALAAEASKSTAGALTTVLARPFTSASGLAAMLKRNWPPSLAVTHVANLVGPDWDQFNEVQKSEFESIDKPLVFNEFGKTGVLLGLPISAAMAVIDYAEEAEAKARWSPCVAQLDSTLRSADLKETFRRRFQLHAGAATSDGPKAKFVGIRADTNVEIKNTLEANISRVMLRKCRAAATYCVEVAVRMMLRSNVENKVIYDAIHVYSTRQGSDKTSNMYGGGYRMWRGHHSWEKPLDRISSCRNIADYCGPEGHLLALKEVETALDAVAAAVVRDLSGS